MSAAAIYRTLFPVFFPVPFPPLVRSLSRHSSPVKRNNVCSSPTRSDSDFTASRISEPSRANLSYIMEFSAFIISFLFLFCFPLFFSLRLALSSTSPYFSYPFYTVSFSFDVSADAAGPGLASRNCRIPRAKSVRSDITSKCERGKMKIL